MLIVLGVSILLTSCTSHNPEREQLPIPLESEYDKVLLFYSSESCAWCTKQKAEIKRRADDIENAGVEIHLLEGVLPFDGWTLVPYNVFVVREDGVWWIEWKHVGYLSISYLLELANEVDTSS